LLVISPGGSPIAVITGKLAAEVALTPRRKER
jgi:hypothetical protein